MNEAIPARPPDGTAGVESRGLDPITVELIQTRLTSIVREMRTVIIRTAYSHMIIEGHDFSSAVLTPAGELVAVSQIEQPTHISALSWSAREVLARYRDDIGPGDLYLHNDPYTGGSHLNDVGLFYPVFHHDRPLAIVAVMAHWQDIGGMVPGSLSGNATEIYQEGIRIPSLRIVRRGVAIDEVLDLLFANVRGPDDRRGDLRAMEGACRIAERHLHAMAHQWGERTIRETLGALLDRAERRMRDAIGRLPDGAYRYETYLDNSGDSPEPLLLKLELTVAGNEIHADFTGCAPQVLGPANLGPAPATTATFTMTKSLLDPTGPINAGALRPIRVTAPCRRLPHPLRPGREDRRAGQLQGDHRAPQGVPGVGERALDRKGEWLAKPENRRAAVDVLKATLTGFRRAGDDLDWFTDKYRKFASFKNAKDATADELRPLWETLRGPMNAWPRDMGFNLANFEAVLPAYKASGAIAGSVDLDAVIQTQYVAQALDELGG